MYLPPQTSYYGKVNSKDIMSKLEKQIEYFSCKGKILVCGDLNARVGCNLDLKYFTDGSKAVLLLRIFYVFVLSYVCYVFVRVCLYVYDKFTLFQYFGQRTFSRKNMHFSINYIVSVPPF